MTVWMGMTVRNVLYGQTVEALNKKFSVTILSNYADLLSKVLCQYELKYEKLRVPRWQFPSLQAVLIKRLYEWNYLALWQAKKPSTAEIIVQWEKENRPLRYFFNSFGALIVRLLRLKKRDSDILRNVVYFLAAQVQLRQFDVIFVSSTDNPKDQMITYACRKKKIPVICLAHSWDNLPGRGMLAAIPDKLLVWNKYMAVDAVNLLGVPENRIEIVGVPQYETYRRLSQSTNLDKFLTRLDIDPDTKVITYTAGVEWIYPDEERLIDDLLSEIENGKFGKAILVIRLHPTDKRSNYYRELYHLSSRSIRLDEADAGFAAMNMQAVGDRCSLSYFVELMQFSAVVLNIASTTTLDALLFDTPVVCPNFSYTIPKNAYNATPKLYNTSHYKTVAQSGAISLPSSFEEMLVAIEEGISFPEKRRKERKILSDTLMPDLPTSELIVKAVESIV